MKEAITEQTQELTDILRADSGIDAGSSKKAENRNAEKLTPDSRWQKTEDSSEKAENWNAASGCVEPTARREKLTLAGGGPAFAKASSYAQCFGVTRRRDKEGADDKAAIRIEANVQPAYAEAFAFACYGVTGRRGRRSLVSP